MDGLISPLKGTVTRLYRFFQFNGTSPKDTKHYKVNNPIFLKLVRILAIIVLTIFFSFATVKFYKKNFLTSKNSKNFMKIVDEALESYIANAVRKSLKHEKPAKRNEVFLNTKPFRGYKPSKINTMSAVFINDSTDETFVLKRTILRNPTQEETISLQLKHPNILNTTDSYLTHGTDSSSEEGHLFLFMEYMDVKISQQYVQADEETIKNIMTDILEGLKFMHSKNIAHLDLKIANIMGQTTSSGIIYKIIDFGFTRDFNRVMGKPSYVKIEGKSYGTFPYKPPEIVFENIHGLKSDIWTIGAICYFLALGKTPFIKRGGGKQTKLYREFLNKPVLEIPDSFSENFKDFVRKCMNKDMEKRPSAEELLSHPFITEEMSIKEYNSESSENGKVDSGYVSTSSSSYN